MNVDNCLINVDKGTCMDSRKLYCNNFAPLIVLQYFVIARFLVCNIPLLITISLNTKCLLVWCD